MLSFRRAGTNYLFPELRLSSRHGSGLQKGQPGYQMPLPQTKRQKEHTWTEAMPLTSLQPGAPNEGWLQPDYRPRCHDYYSPILLLFYSKSSKQVLARSLPHTNEHLSCLRGRTWIEPVRKTCAWTSAGCWTLNQCLMLSSKGIQIQPFSLTGKTYNEHFWSVDIFTSF